MRNSLIVKTFFTGLCLFLSKTVSADRVTVGAFEIDREEVTVSEFAAFADRVGMVTAAEREGGGFEWGVGWERRTGWSFRNPYGKPARQNEPAVHISWQEADSFCSDANGRLPTREEWISAAYTEQRQTPTGGFVAKQTYTYPVGDTPTGMNNNRTNHLVVGSTKSGVNGLYDMGANVWEWLADRQEGRALTAGGSWWYGPEKTRVEGMQWKPAEFYVVYIGFRCVYLLRTSVGINQAAVGGAEN